MDSDDKIRHLEIQVRELKEKEKKLEHDLNLYKQIFTHLRYQFEQMKKNIAKK